MWNVFVVVLLYTLIRLLMKISDWDEKRNIIHARKLREAEERRKQNSATSKPIGFF